MTKMVVKKVGQWDQSGGLIALLQRDKEKPLTAKGLSSAQKSGWGLEKKKYHSVRRLNQNQTKL